MANLTLLHQITENTKEGAITLAFDFATHDADLCGENGPEYLWKEAEGFECNADYVWSIAEKEATPKEMLEKFFSVWLSSDSYYIHYDYSVVLNENKLSAAVVWQN